MKHDDERTALTFCQRMELMHAAPEPERRPLYVDPDIALVRRVVAFESRAALALLAEFKPEWKFNHAPR